MSFRRVAALLLSVVVSATAFAQATAYPNKPIRIVSPFPSGGGTDYLARLLGKKLMESTGWTVVVENKAGANGTLGLTEIARGTPDGYDLVVGQKDNLIIAPWIMKVNYDTTKNFTPIGLMATTPVVFIVAENSPYKTMEDLVRAAKAAPGKISVGSNGTGSLVHLIGEQLQSLGGFKLEHVPYKGTAPALNDLAGGHVVMVGGSVASAFPLLQAKKVRALAVSTGKRIASLPDVPTLSEAGFPGFQEVGLWGLLGPAGMPADIVSKLNAELNKAMHQQDVIDALAVQGITPETSTPQAFGVQLRTEYENWQKIVAAAGLKRE